MIKNKERQMFAPTPVLAWEFQPKWCRVEMPAAWYRLRSAAIYWCQAVNCSPFEKEYAGCDDALATEGYAASIRIKDGGSVWLGSSDGADGVDWIQVHYQDAKLWVRYSAAEPYTLAWDGTWHIWFLAMNETQLGMTCGLAFGEHDRRWEAYEQYRREMLEALASCGVPEERARAMLDRLADWSTDGMRHLRH